MTFLIKNIQVMDPKTSFDEIRSVFIDADGISLEPKGLSADVQLIDGSGLLLTPGFVDLQVHFREPGADAKETLRTGAEAAFAGGITSVVVMPNTKPSLDTQQNVENQIARSRAVSGLNLMVAAAATHAIEGLKQTDFAALKAGGAVCITDDGHPVMSDEIMSQSLQACAEHDLLFMQHAEDYDLSKKGAMNLGEMSEKLKLTGQDSNAEGQMVERDIALAQKTGARYHVLHTTTKRSLDAIRDAKAKGLKITCEASPHHLLLNENACKDLDPNKKMNPPLRSEEDRLALVAALLDGTVDALATDHAPHTQSEKSLGFEKAPFGVVGLETAFSALLTFVHSGRLELKRAVELYTTGPAKVLKQEDKLGRLFGEHARADAVIVDLNRPFWVDESSFHGKNSNSAFLGIEFKGRVMATFCEGRLVYKHRGLPCLY